MTKLAYALPPEEEQRRKKYLRYAAAPAAMLGGLGWAGMAPAAALAPVNYMSHFQPAADAHQILELGRLAELHDQPALTWDQDPSYEGGRTAFRNDGQGNWSSPQIDIGRQARPWVPAHELGHVKSQEVNPGVTGFTTRFYNPLAGPLGAMAAPLAPTRNLARAVAAMSVGASLPMLANEVMASHYGGKLLARQSGHNLDYLKAYGGVPSYAAVAAAPLVSYLIASKLGRWDKKREDDLEPEPTQGNSWVRELDRQRSLR
jgi:hypothetical protein